MYNPFMKPKLPPKDFEQATEQEQNDYVDRYNRYRTIKKWATRIVICLSFIFSTISLIVSLR